MRDFVSLLFKKVENNVPRAHIYTHTSFKTGGRKGFSSHILLEKDEPKPLLTRKETRESQRAILRDSLHLRASLYPFGTDAPREAKGHKDTGGKKNRTT